jgi:hypothetical protein
MVPGRDNHAPVGRRKEIALAMPGLCQNLHVNGVSEPQKKGKPPEKITISCSTASAIPL